MPTTALDIGSYSYKAIVGSAGANPHVSMVIEEINKNQAVIPTDEVQAEKFTEAIANFINDNKIENSDIRLSLPEALVATKIISMPSLTDAELASAIAWQAEQHIPIPKEELSLEYQVLYRPESKKKDEEMRVLLVGAKKTQVNAFINSFLNIGIEPKLLETQTLSIIRSLGFTNSDPATLIAHIGASNMTLAIVNYGELCFVYNYTSGGFALSRAMQQVLNINAEQAEEYKRSYGLNEQKIRNALVPSVDLLVNEISKAIRFFATQYPQAAIQRIVLSGGTAQLPGLMEYLNTKLNLEVLLSSPFATAQGAIPAENNQGMIVTMGLLMREL